METRRASIELGPQQRDFTTSELKLETRADGGRELSFSLSSEAPVERFYGTEVLSHEPGAVRLDRAKAGAMPLLFNHSWDDPVGMVDTASVRDGRLYIDRAHFFNTDRAREVAAMVDGGLRNVSVGYDVHAFEEDRKQQVYRAVDWSPMEASIVSIPADYSVGLGRAPDSSTTRAIPVRTQDDLQPAAQAASQGAHMSEQQTTQAAGAPAAAPPHVVITEDYDAKSSEAERIGTIRKYAKLNDINDEKTVTHWIRSGKDWNAIADDILKIKEQRSKANPNVLDLSKAEIQRFSIVRAINAARDNSWVKAGYEAEVSRALAEKLGKVTNEHTFLMPTQILTREMIVGTASSGGYLVGTDQRADQFIDLLRNTTVAFRLGARLLSGLVGNVAIPTQASGGTGGWLLESGTAAESNLTVGQKTLSPKTVGGFQQISRQLLLQSSPDAESLVERDLAAMIALKLDAAAIAGTSTDSSVPLGVRYTSGLGTANPGTGSAVTYADMIKFQSTVASANALFDGFGYATHPAIAGLLMGKPRFTNSDTPIWEGKLLDGIMVGARALSSVQITSGTVLGGDWGQVYVGEWGSVEIESNPYQNFQAGIVGVRAFLSCDVLVRYGAAFAVGTGITG